MSEPRKLVRIGELLNAAGILSQEQLKEALRRAAETDLPLGKILVWSGYVTDEILRSAVHVQCLLNDKAIPLEGAVAWLAREAGKEPGKEGEKKPAKSNDAATNRLGELLLAAEMVTENELEDALSDSVATGLPLGRVLVYTKNLPDLFVSAGLDAQAAVREGRINREAAIDALMRVKKHDISFDKALTDLGFEAGVHGFSQVASLLRAAGVLSEPKLATAQEMAIVKGKQLSDVLLEFKFLPEKVVSVTMVACRDLVADKIDMSKAVTMIKRAVEMGFDYEGSNSSGGEAEGEQQLGVSAADLLKLARLIDVNEIKKVSPPQLLDTQFVANNANPDRTVDMTLTTALKCVEMIDAGELTLEQAIIVLHYTCRKSVSLPVVLELIGVRVPEPEGA
jgi:hypothetical protein